MACYSYGHAVNYMKGGLVTADRIVTVGLRAGHRSNPESYHVHVTFGVVWPISKVPAVFEGPKHFD